MKSGRSIDISKSSLVSLKAELIRKKEEADQLRGNDKFLKLPPRPVKQVKANLGVADRDLKDREQLTEEEVDLLKKSREVLQIKSTLYDQLQSGQLVSEDGKSRYLVDFERKSPEIFAGPLPDLFKGNFDKRPDSPRSDLSEGEIAIDETEWIEYTDCLGRTRRCHKSDLESMKDRDEELSKQVEKKQQKNPVAGPEVEVDEDRQLMSNDMHLEELRHKWEDKERELLNKQDVHYEDILFNEARSHGVGYWKFSTDEAKRHEEQEMLRRIRSETEQRQKEARSLRERREQQRQSRLIAARQRQRARQGLPPIDVSKILEEIAPKEEEKPAEEVEEEEENEDLEAKLKKAAHVRPWDVGKDGLQQPLMTQEEWNEKKRAERTKEFAPTYREDRKKRRKSPSPSPPPPSEASVDDIGDIPLPEQPIPSPFEHTKNPMMSQTKNFQKRRQRLDELRKRRTGGGSEPYEPDDNDSTASEDEETVALREARNTVHRPPRGRGTEIPPPMDFDYYTPGGGKQKRSKPESATDAAAAIDAGLRILRDQVERTQTAVPKGTYHIDSLTENR